MKDRINEVANFVDKHGKITLHELELAFKDVSSMTLRRDLDRLEKENRVLKVSGGAISVNSVLRAKENDFAERSTFNVEGKQEISNKAISLIAPNSCIFIDGGSTTTFFARALPDDDYYVLTNALVIAETVLRKSKPKVALLGGDLRRGNFITVGDTCLNFIDGINIEIAVMTATGFNKESGTFTCGMQSEASVKRRVIEKADLVIMLIDNSKISKKTPYAFASLSDIDYMVVDDEFPSNLRTVIQNSGVKII